MNVIELRTSIAAPIETCFDLARNIDLELRALQSYGLRAVSGVVSGLIGPGERVGWETRQFGIKVLHTSEITRFQLPAFFQDTMLAGIFRSFQHDHLFSTNRNGRTEMRDIVRFSMPLWLMGSFSERLIVRNRLMRLVRERNDLLKIVAEQAS